MRPKRPDLPITCTPLEKRAQKLEFYSLIKISYFCPYVEWTEFSAISEHINVCKVEH